MKGSRQRIVDAAIALIGRDGYAALNIAAVAAEAGVTRPTVYAHFGNLATLASAATTRVAVAILGPVIAEAEKADSAADYVIEFIVVSRTAIRSNRVLTEVLFARDDVVIFDDEMMGRAITVSGPLVDPAIARDPRLGAARDDLVEVITRIAASVILFSSAATASEPDLRQLLRLWVVPVLRELAER